MILLYNALQILLLPFSLILLPALLLLSPKLRGKLLPRLGFGLPAWSASASKQRPLTIWLHALSVGEVTSAGPLIRGLRAHYPEASLILTVATTTGLELANKLYKNQTQLVAFGPFDFLPSLLFFIRRLRPTLFILVETDFWPNQLFLLRALNIPSLLVNGRTSERSMRAYRRASWFFRPMFAAFSYLCLQTDQDRRNFIALGLPDFKLQVPGNLKYDAHISEEIPTDDLPVFNDKTVLLCGSTHDGEEKLLIRTFLNLKVEFPDLVLVIAPRDPRRATEISEQSDARTLEPKFRSRREAASTDLYILDTLGELIHFYALAQVVFVGGSLSDDGGHNPIEPASFSCPVLFGPHMEDFSEIASDLITAEGAKMVVDRNQLEQELRHLLSDANRRHAMGEAAKAFVSRQQGVVSRHLQLIDSLL